MRRSIHSVSCFLCNIRVYDFPLLLLWYDFNSIFFCSWNFCSLLVFSSRKYFTRVLFQKLSCYLLVFALLTFIFEFPFMLRLLVIVIVNGTLSWFFNVTHSYLLHFPIYVTLSCYSYSKWYTFLFLQRYTLYSN
jgi:hypothetical protein